MMVKKNKTDAEQIKNGVFHVFTQTEFDRASIIEVLLKFYSFCPCDFFINPEKFMDEIAIFLTHRASVKSDDEDNKFSSMKKQIYH